MSSTETIRKIIQKFQKEKIDEETIGEDLDIIMGCLDEIEKVEKDLINDYEADLKSKENELAELERVVFGKERELEAYDSINLGLDTIHFRLENGNLAVTYQLESAFRRINTIDNAEIKIN